MTASRTALLGHLILAVAVTGSAEGAPPAPSAAADPPPARVEAQELLRLPFAPTRVLSDDGTICLFDGRRLACTRRSSENKEFVEVAADTLSAGTQVALRGNLLYVSRRMNRDISVFETGGKLKRRFSVATPPNEIAVDDLGYVSVFSVFPSPRTESALVDIYDRDGGYLRSVGHLPGGPPEKDDPGISRRSDAWPLLRVDAAGHIWALPRDGRVALRLGTSRTTQDEYDLPRDSRDQTAAPVEETPDQKKRREEIEARMFAELEKKGGRPVDREKAQVFVSRTLPRAYVDFACDTKSCAALPRGQSESGPLDKATLLTWDTERGTDLKVFELSPAVDRLIGVSCTKGSFALYAEKAGVLLQFDLGF
jgi:hypothetical protein